MTARRPLKIPPVAVTGIFAVLMWLVSVFTPKLAIALSLRIAAALALAALGLSVIALAVKGFREERTSVNPMDFDRTSAIVTAGIYRVSRNPMYLGMLVIQLGYALWDGSMGVLGFVPFAFIAIDRAVIAKEEKYLAERFGKPFEDYCARVRRWI